MDVRGYLDLCGETPIPTGEGGGSGGSHRRCGRDREQKNSFNFLFISLHFPYIQIQV